MRWNRGRRLLLMMVLLGCDDAGETAAGADAGALDAHPPEAARVDAGRVDLGAPRDATSAPDAEATADAAIAPDDAGPEVDAAPPGPVRPHIVLIIADDLGVESAPCYADDAVAAPTLEALCARGVRFTRAWATPVCSPTRATLLTGQHPFRHGVGAQIEGENARIDLNAATLPQRLEGYRSGLIGKWHLSDGADDPRRMGFAHHAGLLTGAVPDYFRWRRTVNGESARVEQYVTTVQIDDALDWLDGATSPWLLWLALVAPHTPFHVPPPDLHDQALSGTEQDIETNPRAYYRAAIQAMDTELGRLLSTVPVDDTWVVFIGDNGPPARAVEGGGRGRFKGSLYEGGVHVPLVIAGPGVVEGGRAVDALVDLTDLHATLLDLAGQPLPEDLDGQSLVPHLTDPAAPPHRDWALTELFGVEVDPDVAGRAIRDARYKLVRFAGGDVLFDLDEDPNERADLLAAPLRAEAEAAYDALAARLEALTR